MILSLRGTHGSGKSTVMREILQQCLPNKPTYGVLGARLPEAYTLTVPKCKVPVHVLGPYQAYCGGCDVITQFDLIPQLIDKYAARGHVLFEGAIVAGVYGKVGQMLECYGQDVVFVFLNTSEEECIRRVQGRREGRGDDREMSTKSLRSKYAAIERIKAKVEAEKIMRAVSVSSQKGAAVILKMLRMNSV